MDDGDVVLGTHRLGENVVDARGFEDGAHSLTDGCDVTNLRSVSHWEITDLAATPDGATLYASESTTGSRSYVLRADASLSFQRMGDVVAPATEGKQRTAWNLAATYDLKFAKLYGQFLHGEDTQDGAAVHTSLDRNIWWLGFAVPFMDRHTVRGVYGHLDDRRPTDRDSDHYGVGYEFALDKQTDLYAYYAKVTNKNGGTNSLCAGVTDTPALRKIPGNEEMIRVATARNPAKRLTTPQDVANAVAVLAHPLAGWITGNVINVDGGEDIAG